ncbi:HNH endonuclease, partial [Pseudomonas aeruginosa]
FEYDPESESALMWGQRMRNVILPNHFRIQAIIKANLHHMTDAEKQTFARYQEHVRGLSERHVCGVAGGAIRYPEEMDEVLT